MENFDFKNINIKILKLFLTVYETRSVNKAADILGLNQSTVSYSLERLRELFLDPLFVKKGRGIVPTERARSLAPQIRKIVFDMERLLVSEEYKPEEDSEPFYIEVNVAELLPYCKELLDCIRNECPNASVQFVNNTPLIDLQAHSLNDNVDLFFSVRPSRLPSHIHSSPLITTKLICYYDSTIRSPIYSVEEYFKAPHGVVDFGNDVKTIVDNKLESESLSRKIALKAPNVITLAELMQGTDIIATMPAIHAENGMIGLDTFSPPFEFPTVNFDMYWHSRSEHSPRNIWLREKMAEVVEQVRLRQYLHTIDGSKILNV